METNPFPGMNPYMEDPTLWRGVHTSLNYLLSVQLNRSLPNEFIARIEERVYVVQDDRNVYPYFAIYRRENAPPRTAQVGGGAATLVRPDPGITVQVEAEQARERFIEIREARGDQLVAIIEIVSPANKADPAGREAYRQKQSELVGSDIHLLEIDLLRAGPHILAVPESRVQAAVERWDYLLCLHRGTRRFEYTFWATRVQESLPVVSIPLTLEAGEVLLDVGTAVNRCYEEGAFVRTIHYNDEPVPSFAPDDAKWADTLLKEKGLRR